MPPKSLPNGTANTPIEISPLIPPIVGINFGNSYASIAVFTKEGLAECIANEDGERQIACAVSFFGEEIYIGNQAKHQLVKNSKNTITGFRNLLGKKFSEISQSKSTKSAPVIQHPDIPDEPAYKVQILQPAPTPLPQSTHPSNFNTPVASHAATPRSEPVPAERILTVTEVTTMFISSLVDSATDFLGKKVQGVVITVPPSFSEVQKDALEKAVTDAGIHVLQLVDEAGASTVTTTSDTWGSALPPDRTQLIVDLGSSSLSLSLLSIRSGLGSVLASSTTSSIGGDEIDDKLIKFFAADFTKKTKVPLTVCPATDTADQRAEARLRLAIEHTKRTISASPGAATCSVESLKDGVDYTGSINRMRFDMVVRSVYTSVSSAVSELLAGAGIDAYDVDEIVYIGGSTCLPGLDEQVCLSGFREDVETPFARGTVVGGGIGDPTTVLARGCAVQAALVTSISANEETAELKKAFERNPERNDAVKVTSRTVGILLPDPSVTDSDLGGVWVPIVHKDTPLPARRAVRFDVGLTEESKKMAFEVWEVVESIRVEKVVPESVDDDEEEEQEEEEKKHRVIKKEAYFGTLQAEALLGIKTKGKSKDAGKWITSVEIQFVVEITGALKVDLKEVGTGGATVSLKVPAASS